MTGRSNYSVNLGTHGWVYERQDTLVKDSSRYGTFAFNSATRLADVTDGTSHTTLFAEIRRGAFPGRDALDVTLILPPVWGSGPATNTNNLRPPAARNNPTTTIRFTGLQFQRGALYTALYTHTTPPNYGGRDCLRNITLEEGHIASRSKHPGGVNVAMTDGSVRFIRESIQLPVWQALGTRQGGELIDSSSY